MPEVKGFLKRVREDVFEVEELDKILAKAASYPDKLQSFFQNAVKNAINSCDDTKLLKDLLDTI